MNHFFKNIQGWSAFLPIYTAEVKRAPKAGARFVEVGAWRGRSAAFMGVEIANSNKQIEFNVVDTWLGSAEQINRQEPELVAGNLYEKFLENIAPVRKFLNPIRATSVEAAATFPDESLDFVLIDAAHDYDNVMADLTAWYPKVKRGGTLAGDDYRKPGVRKAVLEFFATKQLEFTPCMGKVTIDKCWKHTVPRLKGIRPLSENSTPSGSLPTGIQSPESATES